MKKLVILLLAASMLSAMTACGAGGSGSAAESAGTESQAFEWTRAGYFTDENENMLSITWMDDVADGPGWYVGFMNGEDMIEDSYGGLIAEKGSALFGELPSSGSKDPLVVTITEEGEDGLKVVVEGGETYHFTKMEMPEASIFVSINTEGWGSIVYAEGEETPEIDTEYPYQSAQINLAEPAAYTLLAWPKEGFRFVKWTKNGEDFSTEAQITVLLDESADFIAVFEEDPDYVSPASLLAGEYQCGRAHAVVDSYGVEDIWINIDWGSSASEMVHWSLVGLLDPDTMTIEYENCPRQIIVYDDKGEIVSEETDAEDCSGTVVFGDGTFTWHDDKSEYEEDLVFEKLPDAQG